MLDKKTVRKYYFEGMEKIRQTIVTYFGWTMIGDLFEDRLTIISWHLWSKRRGFST